MSRLPLLRVLWREMLVWWTMRVLPWFTKPHKAPAALRDRVPGAAGPTESG